MADPAPMQVDDPRGRVLELLRAHGWNATSFQCLEPGFRYFQHPHGAVAYVDTGSAWVAGGAPIAPAEHLLEVVSAFQAEAARQKRRVSFFAVEQRFLDEVGLPAIRIGEQPVWDPMQWEDTLRQSRSLREQLRRARAKAVTVRPATLEEISSDAHPTHQAVGRLIHRWLGSRAMAPMGFLVQVDPFSFPLERRWFVAEQNGRLVGFLGVVPIYARGGWFLEDLLREPDAPNGTAELLVDAAMRAAAGAGVRYATLGIAPLSGEVSGWLRRAKEWGGWLYDFEGLRAFKAKLRPNAWEPQYLAAPSGQAAVVTTADVLAAFARGNLLRFGVETVLRGPAIVVQLLAVLLIPWTAMLALAPLRHFPSRGVQLFWIGFDLLLAGGLFTLSMRWRQWLATLLASVVTADAVATLTEGLLYNLRSARAPSDWLVVLVAVLAPSFAAAVLWRARSHRASWM